MFFSNLFILFRDEQEATTNPANATVATVFNGPEQRRRFMDMELCQLDKAYLYYLTQYKKILKHSLIWKNIETNLH